MISWDQVADDALVTAIGATGRRIAAAVSGLRELRYAEDLEIAQWFNTESLASRLSRIRDVDKKTAERLTRILRGDEVQATLQELLTVRLSDRPELYARQAREAFCLALISTDPAIEQFAEPLADFFDDEISAITARLEIAKPEVLPQIRSEALADQTLAILHAIERHIAALKGRPRREGDFLRDYRTHVLKGHGMIEPPDLHYRRPVPIADIYVSTPVYEDSYPERIVSASPASVNSLDVQTLAKLVHRSVVLGDPGNGKTTAANVLMYHFARELPESIGTGRVPFLVELRKYAATDPPVRSIVGYIEHSLDTYYQCRAPAGLVNLLLLNDRAIVIFDGLDELLDASRRRDVTRRLEHFCTEYPLARVLVTSRRAGYDQARLNGHEFTCYRLGSFGDEQVAEYVRKWFALDKDAQGGDAEAFITESASVPDLRSNPLLLSLMCILYRGKGSLPQDRAELYEKCADLLIRSWDAYRRIYHQLRADRQVKPALRYLAWWLYTRKDTRSAVIERELIARTTEFFKDRGFKSPDDARDAAHEFVEFCRGRAWVFTETGKTADDERLYAFTHRTFLEYFAAEYLAYDSDTPEDLANALAQHVPRNEWWAVADLAVQVKDLTSNDGANRIYQKLLEDGDSRPPQERAAMLRFLVSCLRSVNHISEGNLRELTRKFLTGSLHTERIQGASSPWEVTLQELLSSGSNEIIADEVTEVIGQMICCGKPAALVNSLWFAASLPNGPVPYSLGEPERIDFWISHADNLLRTYADAAIAAAESSPYVRQIALEKGLIGIEQALEMPDGLSALLQVPPSYFPRVLELPPYLQPVCSALLTGWPAFGDSQITATLEAVGKYVLSHQEPPWLRGEIDFPLDCDTNVEDKPASHYSLSPMAYLGAVVLLSILTEHGRHPDNLQGMTPDKLGPLRGILPYLARRLGAGLSTELPELPVPDELRQVFRDWATGIVDFTTRART